ncbi:MAG: HPr family phosphocarrier protein [Oscillospiraceae bacterium]|nr:HPr family phosphocarrier protein [Oscillospiraceae bacterium]
MKQFDIALHSFEDVQDFVEVATVQPFRILVGNDRARVNAKSFMGMFSLDFSEPVHVRADCTDEECSRFKQAAARFLV